MIKYWKPGIIVGLTALVAAVVLLTPYRTPDRFTSNARVKKVCSLTVSGNLCWLPGGRILFTTTGQTSQNSNSRWSGQVEEIDALSGRHTVLEGLTAVFNRYSSHFDHDGPLYPGASSDGQWLLWQRRDPASGHTHHVTVKMDGHKNVLGVKIDPEVSGDVEMLQDMVMAAVNEAAKKVDEESKQKMSGMLGGLGLPPGLF